HLDGALGAAHTLAAGPGAELVAGGGTGGEDDARPAGDGLDAIAGRARAAADPGSGDLTVGRDGRDRHGVEDPAEGQRDGAVLAHLDRAQRVVHALAAGPDAELVAGGGAGGEDDARPAGAR